MKKFICLILCVFLLFLTFSPAVSAVKQEERVYFDDGSYLEISEKKPFDDNTESNISFITRLINWLKSILEKLKINKTISKTKYASYYSSKDELLWSVQLKAEFTYNGKRALCTSSDISYIIYDTDWKMLSSSHSENENTATGEFLIKQYKLGVPLKEIERTLTLTCDENGNIK